MNETDEIQKKKSNNAELLNIEKKLLIWTLRKIGKQIKKSLINLARFHYNTNFIN